MKRSLKTKLEYYTWESLTYSRWNKKTAYWETEDIPPCASPWDALEYWLNNNFYPPQPVDCAIFIERLYIRRMHNYLYARVFWHVGHKDNPYNPMKHQKYQIETLRLPVEQIYEKRP